MILTYNNYNYKIVKSEKILIASDSVKLRHFSDHTKWFCFFFIKEFIMAVFTASMSRDMSTHKLDYSFCCSSHRGGYVRENRTLNSIRLWTKRGGEWGGGVGQYYYQNSFPTSILDPFSQETHPLQGLWFCCLFPILLTASS